MITIQKIFKNFVVFDTLRDISKVLQNLRFLEPSIDEIAGGGGWSR